MLAGRSKDPKCCRHDYIKKRPQLSCLLQDSDFCQVVAVDAEFGVFGRAWCMEAQLQAGQGCFVHWSGEHGLNWVYVGLYWDNGK